MDRVDASFDKLIYSIMYKYFRFYKEKEDLYQAGYIGLLSALANYDSSYDTKFSTYAYPYIYGEMIRQINNDKNIKVNRQTNYLYLKITKAMSLLSQKLMHEPLPSEVAMYLGIDEQLVIDALSSAYAILNVDDRELGYNDPNLDNIALNEEINKLDNEEYLIINRRYKEDLTQQEVANIMGISQVQVSRKEKKILEKLKSNLI